MTNNFQTCEGCKTTTSCQSAQLCWNKLQEETAREKAAYIKAGVCRDCGACSEKEAGSKCRPRPVGDTGDYDCAGDELWQEDAVIGKKPITDMGS